MDRPQPEHIELDQQLWQKWIQKGKLREQARIRRWRRVGGVICLAVGVIGLLGLTNVAELSRGALAGSTGCHLARETGHESRNSPEYLKRRFRMEADRYAESMLLPILWLRSYFTAVASRHQGHRISTLWNSQLNYERKTADGRRGGQRRMFSHIELNSHLDQIPCGIGHYYEKRQVRSYSTGAVVAHRSHIRSVV